MESKSCVEALHEQYDLNLDILLNMANGLNKDLQLKI